MDILNQIIDTFLGQSVLELTAVICAILYLVLVVKENIWCWFFAFVSTAIYIYLFHKVALFSESVLNVYYLFMAVYGWWQWKKEGPEREVHIQNWPAKIHLRIIVACLLLTPLIGYYMDSVGASFPYLDALVALMAVAATIMVAYKVFENWYYWLVVDTVSIYLFWQKQMYMTAALFVIYIILIFAGIKNWQKLMIQQKNES